MDIELRESVETQIHMALAENIINSITGEELNTGVNELELFGNKMPGTSPLGFIDKTVDITNTIQDALDIKKNGLVDFYTDLIPLLFKEEHSYNTRGTLEYEIETTAESVIEAYEKNMKRVFLSEDIMNEKEVIDIIHTQSAKIHNMTTETIMRMGHFHDEYILSTKNNKTLTKLEKDAINKISSAYLRNINLVKDFAKFIENISLDKIMSPDNRKQIIEEFKTIGVAIAVSSILAMTTRILFGNNALTYTSKTTVESIFGTEKEKNINSVVDYTINTFRIFSVDILSSIFNKKELADATLINSLARDINPSFNSVLNLMLGVNDSSFEFDKNVATAIAKQSSVSAKYVHHIDQLFKSLSNSFIHFNRMMEIFITIPLQKLINGNMLENLLKEIKSFVNATNILNSDILALTIGGAAVVRTKFEKEISNVLEDSKTAMNIYNKYVLD